MLEVIGAVCGALYIIGPVALLVAMANATIKED